MPDDAKRIEQNSEFKNWLCIELHHMMLNWNDKVETLIAFQKKFNRFTYLFL